MWSRVRRGHDEITSLWIHLEVRWKHTNSRIMQDIMGREPIPALGCSTRRVVHSIAGFKNGLFALFCFRFLLLFCFRFASVLLPFCFRFASVLLSFCFCFAFVLLSFCASETKTLFVFGRKSGRNEKPFRLRNEKPFRFAFRFIYGMRSFLFGARHLAQAAQSNRMMPRRPNSGSRPTSDGGRPQRLAAARSPHGRPRPARSPRAARSPRIGAPTIAPSTAEQQPPPVVRIVDFGERREERAAAASAQRRRRRDADEAEFDGRAAPRPNGPNARWREQWRIVMVDIAMGPLPAHLSSRGGRSAPLARGQARAAACPNARRKTEIARGAKQKSFFEIRVFLQD